MFLEVDEATCLERRLKRLEDQQHISESQQDHSERVWPFYQAHIEPALRRMQAAGDGWLRMLDAGAGDQEHVKSLLLEAAAGHPLLQGYLRSDGAEPEPEPEPEPELEGEAAVIAALERDPKPFEEWHAAFLNAEAKMASGLSHSDGGYSPDGGGASCESTKLCSSSASPLACTECGCTDYHGANDIGSASGDGYESRFNKDVRTFACGKTGSCDREASQTALEFDAKSSCALAGLRVGGVILARLEQRKQAAAPREPELEPESKWVVKKGAHAKTADGRVGLVQADPDKDGEVKLHLSDGSTTSWIKVNTLSEASAEEYQQDTVRWRGCGRSSRRARAPRRRRGRSAW
jgi:hypothetical protein